MSAHDGGMLYRMCTDCTVPGGLVDSRCRCERMATVGTLADYLGVGSGALAAEWHVVQPDGSLLPALNWRATAEPVTTTVVS